MSQSIEHAAEEYESLRDEMLRIDDQAVQLAGFSLVAASFLAAAVVEAKSAANESLLLMGFNIIILTLVLKVHEKRGQQGRIAAYIRVFHEHPSGWETRVHKMRVNERTLGASPWGTGDPRGWAGGPLERFTRRAAVGERLLFSTLSVFAWVALPLSLVYGGTSAPDHAKVPVGPTVAACVIQTLITGLVLYASRTFRQLEAKSEEWQVIWSNDRVVTELARRITDAGDIIFINGGPASGKSTLGLTLQSLLGIELISKDDLKEGTADELRADHAITMHDRGDWTLTLPDSTILSGDAAMDWLDDEVTEALLRSCSDRRPCLIDANVTKQQAPLFEALAPRLVEIHLRTHTEELRKRYNARPDRHWVHASRAQSDASTWGGMEPLSLNGVEVIEVKTGRDDTLSADSRGSGFREVLAKLAMHYGLRLEPAEPQALADAKESLLARFG